MTSHLVGLNDICQSASHCCRLSRSSCIAAESAGQVTSLYSRQSSANSRACDVTQSGRSLM